MPHLTILPPSVVSVPRGTRQFFRYRHHLVFCWTLVLLLVCPGKATLCNLARLGPRHICEWHLRRFFYASYWCLRVVLWWLVDAVLAVWPPPQDGVVDAVVDKTVKDKTATHHPFTKKELIGAWPVRRPEKRGKTLRRWTSTVHCSGLLEPCVSSLLTPNRNQPRRLRLLRLGKLRNFRKRFSVCDHGVRNTVSAAIMDSQSVKTTEESGGIKGYDGGKQVRDFRKIN